MQIPYQLVAAVPLDQRYAQMTAAIQHPRRFPRLAMRDIHDDRSLSIACYGPSLADTWSMLRRPILSMSGATRFLADRGLVPDYHVDMDPRAHKTRHLDPPIPGVTYLMASHCPPVTWDLLAAERVLLWHARHTETTYEWVQEHDPGSVVIWTGSTIGLGALHVGGCLGYRHFEIHGMDGSYAPTDPLTAASRHAGPHYGPHQEKRRCTWDAGGRTYHTTQIMANAVAETINLLRAFPIFCVFHGDGLTQALVREAQLDNACCADELDRAAVIRRARPVFLDLARPPDVADRPPITAVWDWLLDWLDSADLLDLLTVVEQAEPRRAAARYNTGSIPLETALLLRAVCRYYQPSVIAEIGTFIGTSTQALLATSALYTCDCNNDCFHPVDPLYRCFPRHSSTQMLEAILAAGDRVDCFFFDGRIQPADLPLIQRLSHADTIYLFDDCSNVAGADKGLANLVLLQPFVPQHLLVAPHAAYAGRSTLAMLLSPTAMQRRGLNP